MSKIKKEIIEAIAKSINNLPQMGYEILQISESQIEYTNNRVINTNDYYPTGKLQEGDLVTAIYFSLIDDYNNDKIPRIDVVIHHQNGVILYTKCKNIITYKREIILNKILNQ